MVHFEKRASAYIEAQTVESTIRAYGNGEIELPKPERIDGTTRYADPDRESRNFPYSKTTIALFLGWVDWNEEEQRWQPNHCCNVAFHTVDSFIEGVVTRKQLRGVKRDIAREIVTKARLQA